MCFQAFWFQSKPDRYPPGTPPRPISSRSECFQIQSNPQRWIYLCCSAPSHQEHCSKFWTLVRGFRGGSHIVRSGAVFGLRLDAHHMSEPFKFSDSCPTRGHLLPRNSTTSHNINLFKYHIQVHAQYGLFSRARSISSDWWMSDLNVGARCKVSLAHQTHDSRF